MRRKAGEMLLRLGAMVVPLACGGGDGADTPITASMRDSAGVRIVESPGPAWGPSEGWWLVAEPSLDITVPTSDSVSGLHGVLDALRLPDGRIVVGHAAPPEIRFYSARGRHVTSAGGRGDGPGALQRPMRLWLSPAGEIAVADSNRGVSVFSDRGAFQRSLAIDPLPDLPAPFIQASLADGTLLGAVPSGGLTGRPGSVIRIAWLYHRYGSDGRPMNELARMDARPRFMMRWRDGTRQPLAVPLTTEPSVAAGGGRLFVGGGMTPEVERRALDGSLEAIYRWSPVRLRTADVWQRFKRETLGHMRDDEQRRRDALYFQKDLPLSDYVPVYQSFLLDDARNLWVERYRVPWDTIPRWDVFDSSGRWLGDVQMPPRFDVFRIGEDYVLGRHRDAVGSERVRLYALQR